MRVGTYGQSQAMVAAIESLRAQQAKDAGQVATGLKSEFHSDYSPQDIGLILALRNLEADSKAYLNSNALLSTRLKLGQEALAAAGKAVADLKSSASALDGSDPLQPADAAMLQEKAFSAMKTFSDALNANDGTGFLFSGGKTGTAPMDIPFASSLEFQKAYDGTTTPWPLGGSGAAVWYRGDAWMRTDSISPDRTVQTTIPASGPSMQAAMDAMGTLAQGGLAQHPERIAQAIAALSHASSGLDAAAKTLALSEAETAQAGEALATSASGAAGVLGRIVDADPAATAANLASDRAALDAAYAAFAATTRKNLIDYLA